MKKDEQIPYFARFLESQEYVPVESGVKAGPGGGHGGGGGGGGGGGHVTLKYPSDDDEGGVEI
jgi:hypothetical protein